MQLMIHSLYSNKEIFLRELISNASDAADKLRFEALGANPELVAEDAPDLSSIASRSTKTAAHLSRVSDNGIGMSRDDLIRNPRHDRTVGNRGIPSAD